MHTDFNPRSPCGERLENKLDSGENFKFQSTLPVWGATRKQAAREQQAQHFNPRSPCGERQFNPEKEAARTSFQSTLPVWGATITFILSPPSEDISIHAPRVGSDAAEQLKNGDIGISIHAPRVGSDDRAMLRRDFNVISIHAPRVGSD